MANKSSLNPIQILLSVDLGFMSAWLPISIPHIWDKLMTWSCKLTLYIDIQTLPRHLIWGSWAYPYVVVYMSSSIFHGKSPSAQFSPGPFILLESGSNDSYFPRIQRFFLLTNFSLSFIQILFKELIGNYLIV